MAKKIKPTQTPDLNQPLSVELLGEVVRAMRTQSQLRLEDAAGLCGVAKQTLMNIERGSGTSQMDTVLQVCEGLGIKLFVQDWSKQGSGDNDWQ